jgi:hypothetical protein
MPAWLAPEGFKPLHLSAVTDVGLMLPYTEYPGSPFIIGYLDNELWAIDYSGKYYYEAIKCEDTSYDWKGLYVPNLQIEIDLSSAFEIGFNPAQPGCLIRDSDKLYVAGAVRQQGYSRQTSLFSLIKGLEVSGLKERIGFSKWRVKVGDDDKRDIFLDIDLSAQSSKDSDIR